MNPDFKEYLLNITNSSECKELEIIQSLWSGYGTISRYQLEGAKVQTVVVKCISLIQMGEHPRGWNTNNSHNRKVKSYEVETHWYENWSQCCTVNCRVPEFLGSFSQGKEQWIILEDLDVNFPIRKKHLEFSEVKGCLKWLASFHATFLNIKPRGLWDVGTYWHLATRPDEYERIDTRNFRYKELKSKAHLLDDILNQCTYQTIVHGDAKLANFCFSEDGKNIAAVDFQYVGGGCGMKDVAYFLGSCLSSSECELYEDGLLDYYFLELQKASDNYRKPFSRDKIEFVTLKEEWRGLYPVACADFTRFLLGWMPTHQKVNEYSLKIMDSVLSSFK